MSSNPFGRATVADVEDELKRREAEYEASRKGLLSGWQNERKHLRALLDVLKDQEGVKPEDAEEK